MSSYASRLPDACLTGDGVPMSPSVVATMPAQAHDDVAAAQAQIGNPARREGFFSRVMSLLSNPYLLLGSMLVGVYIGLRSPEAIVFLTPVADLYIGLLKMVLIPFLVSAIMVSLSRLLGSDQMRRDIQVIAAVFVSGLAAVAVVGIVGAVTLAPGGHISATSRQVLGQVVNQSPYAVDIEVSLNEPRGATKETHAGTMFDRYIPTNIFDALTTGDQLKILFFSIAFGVGLGFLRFDRGGGLQNTLLSLYDLCTNLIAWINKLLPIALCAMVAKQVSTAGSAQLSAMVNFTFGFGLIAMAVCLGAVLVIAWSARVGVIGALRAVREPFLLAVATRSSVTCIPAAMESLADRLGYDRARVEMLLPLGITLFRFGPVLYFAFATIFVAQLHGVSLTGGNLVLVFAGALLAGFASAGTSGVLTISLLGIIFQPLGLPLEAALALLVMVDPVVDVFRTAAIVLPNCAAVSVVYRQPRPAVRLA